MTNLGKHFSKKWRNNISKALIGHPISNETREKISQSNLGKHSLRRYLIEESKSKRFYWRHKEKRNADSKRWRQTHKEYFENYKKEHKEELAVYFKKYQEEHREKRQVYSANYYKQHRVQELAKHSHWAKTHRENKNAMYHKRKAILLGLPPELNTLTSLDVLEVLSVGKCFYCGKLGEMTIDHYIPLSKGGINTKENTVAACSTCQSRKFNKMPEVFLEELRTQQIAFLASD